MRAWPGRPGSRSCSPGSTTRRPTRREDRLIDGILLVDKPAGPTSHDVIDVVRRALGERRAGHAGTLDPFATGLLIVLLGRATRLLPYLPGEPKSYEAVVRFGTETATDDATGAITREAPPPPSAEVVDDAIERLTGTIDQEPPAYSAKQVGGQRAYAAARRGVALALEPARVTVHAWTSRDYDGHDLRATIACSGGTYIRALARDLGRLTGSAAHLATLRRTRSGPFDVRDAVTLEAIRAGAGVVRPSRDALANLPSQTLDASDVGRVARGQSVPAAVESARAALVDASGALVAVAERDGDRWHPRVVMVDA